MSPRPRSQVDLARLTHVYARAGATASVDDLARACGLAKPTLYARVGDKADLFRATAEFELERLLARLHDAADRTRYAGVRERIAAIALELADVDRDGARLLFLVDPAPAGLRRLRAAIVEPLRRDSRLPPDGAEAVASALLGAYALAVASGDSFDADTLARLLAASLTDDGDERMPHWGA